MADSFGIKFWGTRGLISTPGRDMAVYGGNTPCIQILYNDHLIIVDTGFGASMLGERLMGRILGDGESLNIHIFYTHFHWDHIQGLPFFHPIYFPSSTLNIYSPAEPALCRDNLNILFDGSYSPFAGIGSMPSQIQFHKLGGSLDIDGLEVNHHKVDHGSDETYNTQPPTFAYKFNHPDQRNLVIATDHEARVSQTNRNFCEWAKGTDLLIHDAQFFEAEYAKRVGWGHSTTAQALENARLIKPGEVLFTHHDPSHSDKEIREELKELRQNPRYQSIRFQFACEGVVYEIPSKKAKSAS